MCANAAGAAGLMRPCVRTQANMFDTPTQLIPTSGIVMPMFLTMSPITAVVPGHAVVAIAGKTH